MVLLNSSVVLPFQFSLFSSWFTSVLGASPQLLAMIQNELSNAFYLDQRANRHEQIVCQDQVSVLFGASILVYFLRVCGTVCTVLSGYFHIRWLVWSIVAAT